LGHVNRARAAGVKNWLLAGVKIWLRCFNLPRVLCRFTFTHSNLVVFMLHFVLLWGMSNVQAFVTAAAAAFKPTKVQYV
jgi:hypothetical protein